MHDCVKCMYVCMHGMIVYVVVRALYVLVSSPDLIRHMLLPVSCAHDTKGICAGISFGSGTET